jgi:hypothetical protein
MDIRRWLGGYPGTEGTSIARKLGEMAVATRLGDVHGAAKAGMADEDVVDGVILGERHVGNDVGAKFGEMEADSGFIWLAEALGIVGRKLGDVANESVRFAGAVANRALKSGDVEPVVAASTSFGGTQGHMASAPSSTWS